MRSEGGVWPAMQRDWAPEEWTWSEDPTEGVGAWTVAVETEAIARPFA